MTARTAPFKGGWAVGFMLLAAAGPTPAWQVRLTQLDKAGTVVGEVLTFPCVRTGCEHYLALDIEGKPRQFLAAITFVPKGAYLGLQSVDQGVTRVVEFDKGFTGPIFLQMRSASDSTQILRFTLTGPALAESESTGPQLMTNSRSMVFQRKLEPDLRLKMDLLPP